ncbi:MAG TPA: hypothetical protein PLF01_06210 [Alphaproteobacteria bacterium]|nr:hypothetical protein [Alphaproteobacteria bacterium]
MTNITEAQSTPQSFANAAAGTIELFANAARNVWFNARPSKDVIVSDFIFSRSVYVKGGAYLVAKQAKDGSYDLQRRNIFSQNGIGPIQTGLSLEDVFNSFKKHNTVNLDGTVTVLESGKPLGNVLPARGVNNTLYSASEPDRNLLAVPKNAIHYTKHPEFKGFGG